MTPLTPSWNGVAFGTNTGKLHLEFSQQHPSLVATLRFMDDASGVVEYSLTGVRDENGHIILDGGVVNGQPNVEYGKLHIEGELTAENTMRGSWNTDIGTGGNYVLHPFVTPSSASSNAAQQIVTKRVYLGFIRLDREDIDKIAQHITRDFSIGKIVATYIHEGTEGSTLYDDFVNLRNLRRLNYLKLFVNEPEGNGFNRVVVMEFRSHGINEIMIQGSQEAWVTGRAVMLENLMKDFSDAIQDKTVKFSGALQIAIFIAFVIIVSTDITLTSKIVWGVATFVLVQVFPWFVQWAFPRARIVMGTGKTHWSMRLLSKAGTWIAGIAIALLASLLTQYGEDLITKTKFIIDTLVGSSQS